MDMTGIRENTEELTMTLLELAAEYEADCRALEKRLSELKAELESARGNDVFLLNRKIKIYTDMLYESRYLAKYLRNYYADKRGNFNENGLYRQRPVGVYYAVLDTFKCVGL